MPKPNIILIVADTLRKDSLLEFINKENSSTSSHIGRLSDDSVIYGNTYSTSSWTIPAHASIFLGNYPIEHGIHELDSTEKLHHNEMSKPLYNSDIEPLTVSLSKKGYTCYGISSNPFISPGSGFDRGFDVFTYQDIMLNDAIRRSRKNFDQRHGHFEGSSLTDIMKKMSFSTKLYYLFLKYREKKSKDLSSYPLNKQGETITNLVKESSLRPPFFLFLNLMEMHEPYLRSEYIFENFLDLLGIKEIGNRRLEKMKELYDSGLHELDCAVGNIINFLKESGEYDNTLVILTSDHGQSFKERGFYGHGTFLYDELVSVPLIIKYPGQKLTGNRDGLHSLADLKELIEEISDTESDTEMKERNAVFSESYGIHDNIYQFLEKNYKSKMKEVSVKLEKFDSKRRLVVLKDFKLTVNMASGEIEDATYKGKKADLNQNKKLFQEAIKKLKIFSGNEKIKLPDFE